MVGAYGLGAALPIGASPPPEALRDGVAAPATGRRPRGVDFSDTNVQEAGVDEPDLVKTDGRTVFAIAGGAVRVTDVTGAAPRGLGPASRLGRMCAHRAAAGRRPAAS